VDWFRKRKHKGYFKNMHQLTVYLTHYCPALPFGSRKKNLEDLLSLVLSQFKKYHPSENLKFNNFGISQS